MMWVLDVLWSWHLLVALVFGLGWWAVGVRRKVRSADAVAPAPSVLSAGRRGLLGRRSGHAPLSGRGGGL